MAEERDEFLSKTTGKVRKRRKDGWTKRDIEIFLSHLRVTGNVFASAAAAGRSERSAYNLRAIDVEFAAAWDAADAETDARLERKIALCAETGGKLPLLRDDGEPAEAPLEDFDPHLAMAYLNYRSAKKDSRGSRGGPRPKSASPEELVEVGVQLLGMMKRRRARLATA